MCQIISGEKKQCRIAEVNHVMTESELETCMRANHKKLWETLRAIPEFYAYLPDSQFTGFGPYTV